MQRKIEIRNKDLGWLERNRKFKLALATLLLTIVLFVIPEVITTVVDYEITQDYIVEIEMIRETEPTYMPPVGLEQRKLGFHLLGAGHFVALITSIMGLYFTGNIIQKRFVPYDELQDSSINVDIEVNKQLEEPL